MAEATPRRNDFFRPAEHWLDQSTASASTANNDNDTPKGIKNGHWAALFARDLHSSHNDAPVNFDLMGLQLGSNMKIRPRSPASRFDPLSFLQEISTEQLHTYTTDQLTRLLRQRQDQYEIRNRPAKYHHEPASWIPKPPGFDPTASSKPWVPDEVNECQMRFCHRCRPTCATRATLSIDGILHDDIPPTAAVGFGFHLQGTRPVVSANIVRNIGFRAVPWLSSPNMKPPPALDCCQTCRLLLRTRKLR
ncbi:hypothetical protein Micbo1qcDRAFT_173433 [Microdochium bolleyi]|uniref:Uncharacterized protein n=1 Tax=Microdochium bolleyi TaxID=196109 RepID=A0A136JBX2_9PEZI|nr:hypothetical protein Micbo1qcDRAFT_173433 [Microdochium bolleyi]